MIVFNNIDITAFKGIFHCYLDFNDLKGQLYSLEGKNNTVDFATSNGSGKSTLCSALMFALYGTVDDIYVKKSEYQNKNTKKLLKIKLNLTIQNINYTLERTNDSFQLFKDGEDISELTKTDTEKKFQDILNLSKAEFVSFTYLSQSGSSSFLSKTPSEKLNCIKDFIFGEELKTIQQSLENLSKELKNKQDNLKVVCSSLKGNIDALEYVLETNKNIDTDKTSYPLSLEEYEEKLKQLKDKLEEKRKVEVSKANLESLISHTKKQIENVKNQYSAFKQGKCPTCGQVLVDNKAIEKFKTDVVKLNETHKTYKQQYDTVLLKLDDFGATLDIKDQISNFESIIKNITIQQNKFNVDFDSITKDIKQKNTELQKLLEEELSIDFELQQLSKLQNYFKTTFIKEIQQSFLTEIENYLNLYCYDVFGEKFKLVFTNNSLDLTVGDKPYSYFSGGERQRLDFLFVFAIKVALASFTNKCTNLFICDETLSGQDSKAFENCLDLVNSLTSAEDLTTILVSHRDISNSLNKIIIERFDYKTELNIINNY